MKEGDYEIWQSKCKRKRKNEKWLVGIIDMEEHMQRYGFSRRRLFCERG
jgi:hypothetical protein